MKAFLLAMAAVAVAGCADTGGALGDRNAGQGIKAIRTEGVALALDGCVRLRSSSEGGKGNGVELERECPAVVSNQVSKKLGLMFNTAQQ